MTIMMKLPSGARGSILITEKMLIELKGKLSDIEKEVKSRAEEFGLDLVLEAAPFASGYIFRWYPHGEKFKE